MGMLSIPGQYQSAMTYTVPNWETSHSTSSLSLNKTKAAVTSISMHAILMYMLYTLCTKFIDAQFYLVVSFCGDYVVTQKVAEYGEASRPSGKHNFSVVLS